MLVGFNVFRTGFYLVHPSNVTVGSVEKATGFDCFIAFIPQPICLNASGFLGIF